MIWARHINYPTLNTLGGNLTRETMMACRTLLAALAAALASLTALAVNAFDAPPVAPVRPVTDEYFGTRVVDNYRYLEDLGDPQVQSWMKAQSEYTRAILDGLPGRGTLLERIHALSNANVERNRFVRRGQRYFYQMTEPGAQLPKLLYRDGLQGEEHVLVDPTLLDKGSTTHYSLDYFMPSWDGR